MPLVHRKLLESLVWTNLAILGVAGPALAQAAPEGKAMQLTVRPSGYDAQTNEAQERQQKLLKRMEQADYMVRSICVNCGDHWKHQTYAPFNPLASLKPSTRTSDESSN